MYIELLEVAAKLIAAIGVLVAAIASLIKARKDK